MCIEDRSPMHILMNSTLTARNLTSTSNHNAQCTPTIRLRVVIHLISTSNHNVGEELNLDLLL